MQCETLHLQIIGFLLVTISVFIIDVLQNESDGVNNSSIVINWLLIKRACVLLRLQMNVTDAKLTRAGS